jgi:Glucose-6-phosphate dehydrogenase, NAD binding domain
MGERMGADGRQTSTASSGDHEADAARRAPACALVIFGASGDLTERKLLPAIRQLAAHGRLGPEFALVGVARTAMSDEEWAAKCLSDDPGGTAAEWAPKASFRYVSGGYDDRKPTGASATCSPTVTVRWAPPAAMSSTWRHRRGCSVSSRSGSAAAG